MVPPGGMSGGYRGNRPPMRGGSGPSSSRDAAPASASLRPKKRVLFVCIGNAIRSQMAEAFARAYGSDVLAPDSAGLSPATMIPPLTTQILRERNIRMDGQFPKGIEMMRDPYDLVVNLSGQRLNLPGARILEWPVPDPIGQTEPVFRAAANHIEGLVMKLILELRAAALTAPARPGEA